MQNSKKIWGIYNTLNEDELDKLNEFEVWKKIHSLSNEIKCLLNYSKKKENKDICIKALVNEKFNLEYLVYYTKKFGVEFDFEPTYNRHVEQSTSFIRWYNFWYDYAKSINLEDPEIDIEKYSSSKKWKDDIEVKNKEIKLQKVY